MPQTTIPTLHLLAHSQAHRCHWMLEELRLSDPTFTYHLETYARTLSMKDLAAIHRLAKSPILTLETTDGSLPPLIQLQPGILTESKCILEFLNTEYGGGRWTPRTPEDQRRDAFFAEFATASLGEKTGVACAVEAMGDLAPWPLSRVYRLMALPLVHKFRNDMNLMFTLLEDALGAEKMWFGGREMGVSDFCMAWGMDVAVQRGYCDLKKYEKLRGWVERVQGREAKKRAFEMGGGYDLVTWGTKGRSSRLERK